MWDLEFFKILARQNFPLCMTYDPFSYLGLHGIRRDQGIPLLSCLFQSPSVVVVLPSFSSRQVKQRSMQRALPHNLFAAPTTISALSRSF